MGRCCKIFYMKETDYINQIISSTTLILNQNLTVKSINRAGLQSFDIKELDIVGKHITELVKIKQQNNHQENTETVLVGTDWEELFNSIPMPVFVKDREHRWVIFNDALCRLQNKTREELKNKNDYDFFPKTQADIFWKEEEQIFESKKEYYTEEPSLRNGVDSHVLIKKTIVTTNEGRDYLLGCCIDITQRKKAEIALIESERRFRSLVQNSPDIIMILEKNNTLRYVTPSFSRIFGYVEVRILGQSIFEFIHSEDTALVKETIQNITEKQSKMKTPIEFRVKKADGSWAILQSFFNNILFDPAINGIVINASDITELRNQAMEIQRMNILLQSDNEKLELDLKNEVKARVDLREVNLDEFKKIYPNDEACFLYLSQLKWKDGFACKKCDNPKSAKGKAPYSKRCTLCGYDESATANTIFYRLKFPIIKAFYMAFLLSSHKKITAKELSAMLTLRKDTCAVFKRKFLTVMNNKENKLARGWEGMILVSSKHTKSR